MKKRKRTQAGFVLSIILIFGSFSCERKAEPEPFQFKTSIGAKGCIIEQLTDEDFDTYQFQGVSADGQWLAYAWNKGEDENGNPQYGAGKLNLFTGESTPLPKMINNTGSFSPDGKSLVIAQNIPEGRTDIYELNLENETATAIAPDSAWDYLASYSPDGAYILFNSFRSGNSEIYLYNRESKALKQLTNFDGYDAHGEFSADGSKILFHRMLSARQAGGYNFDLYSYDMASGEETRLTDMAFEESYASWSPNGEAFVFSADFEEKPEKHNLYVKESDENMIPLTDGDWKDSYAYWSRDGKYIYFNSDRSGTTHVYRIKMDGCECVKAE